MADFLRTIIVSAVTSSLIASGVFGVMRASGVARRMQGYPQWQILVGTFVTCLAAAIGIFVGVAQADPIWELSRFWHWLAVIAIPAAIAISLASGQRAYAKILVWAMVSFGCAWFLVPTWPNLTPARPVHVVFLGTYLSCLCCLFGHCSKRLTSRECYVLPVLLILAVAVAMSAAVSLTFGRIACAVAGGLMGCFVVAFNRDDRLISRLDFATFSGLLCGMTAFVGYVYPQNPAYALLLLPVVPMILLGLPQRVQDQQVKHVVLRWSLVLVAMTAAVGIVVMD